ncbi:MAG: bifunctional DNA-formamidopyrimidine glycosylase/DNA-(apurinic or apyrimidinic site) lyase [Planctomycetaceae bacterium]|nr:bifunctional DNA-formamidopyrimidine glycosylase/DNA-(apurinic or apyrimidinic site) lyase [Planctomycetaceae bacterium]
MPELPEVETMRRGLRPIVGTTIRAVERPPCARKPITITPRWSDFRRRLIGRCITGLDRVGKRVVIELDSGERLLFEPRMTGLVLLADPPSVEHLRLLVQLDGVASESLMYWDRRGLGLVRLLTADEFQERYHSGDIGPDALKITVDDLRARLGASRRAIKVAILDQRALAGVGNLYASELLFLAAIDPRRRCDQLRLADWQRLHQAMIDVLELAIRYEGSTLSDGTYRNALNEAGGFQNHHRVYDRAGEPCAVCRQPIERIVQAQRSTFFCKQCQGRSRRASGKT